MRRLVSKEEEARKKKRNQIILGFVLVLVLILSSISFALQGGLGNADSGGVSGDETEYNGFKFTNQNGLWVFESFVFRYLPQEVDDIGFGIKPISNYQGKPAYVYSEDENAEIDVVVNLGRVAQRVQKACPEGTNCSVDLPVKTCNDNFIIIKEGIENSIVQENNCVFIKGKKEDLAALADQFLFKTLGIK